MERFVGRCLSADSACLGDVTVGLDEIGEASGLIQESRELCTLESLVPLAWCLGFGGLRQPASWALAAVSIAECGGACGGTYWCRCSVVLVFLLKDW